MTSYWKNFTSGAPITNEMVAGSSISAPWQISPAHSTASLSRRRASAACSLVFSPAGEGQRNGIVVPAHLLSNRLRS